MGYTTIECIKADIQEAKESISNAEILLKSLQNKECMTGYPLGAATENAEKGDRKEIINCDFYHYILFSAPRGYPASVRGRSASIAISRFARRFPIRWSRAIDSRRDSRS